MKKKLIIAMILLVLVGCNKDVEGGEKDSLVGELPYFKTAYLEIIKDDVILEIVSSEINIYFYLHISDEILHINSDLNYREWDEFYFMIGELYTSSYDWETLGSGFTRSRLLDHSFLLNEVVIPLDVELILDLYIKIYCDLLEKIFNADIYPNNGLELLYWRENGTSNKVYYNIQFTGTFKELLQTMDWGDSILGELVHTEREDWEIVLRQRYLKQEIFSLNKNNIPSGNYELVGFVDEKIPVTMWFNIDSEGNVSGRYYYDKHRINITIEGNVDKNIIYMRGYESREIVDEFVGTFDKNNISYIGNLTSIGSGKSYSFSFSKK